MELATPAVWPLPRVVYDRAACSIHGLHVEDDAAVLYPWFWLPEHWQIQLWGAVLDDEQVVVCPNVYADWAHAVKTRSRLLEGARLYAAEQAYRRWNQALADREARAANSPHAIRDFTLARCGRCGGGFQEFLGRWMHDCPKQPMGGANAASGEASIRPPAGSTAVPKTRGAHRADPAFGKAVAEGFVESRILPVGAADPTFIPTDTQVMRLAAAVKERADGQAR